MSIVDETPELSSRNRLFEGKRYSDLQPKRVREVNLDQVLGLIYRHSPCSRADIVRLSGLTAPTISTAVNVFRRQRLVKFIGAGDSTGGRPPQMVEFNAKAGYVAGAAIGDSQVRLALADLNGSILSRWSGPLYTDRSPKAVVASLIAGVGHVCEHAGLSPKSILQISVGAPGISDVREGLVVSAPNLERWMNVPLRNLLQSQLGVPTAVDNDVNLSALGERWCGVAQELESFVFLSVGNGVGAGIVLNGDVHHGSRFSAGEIGYMLVPGLAARSLQISKAGSLESVISSTGIETAWAEKSKSKNMKAAAILDLAASGERQAQKLLGTAARYLALAIANTCLILDVSVVVLGGTLGSHPALVELTQSMVQENEFAKPQLLVSKLQSDAQLYGAVWLSLQLSSQLGFRRKALKV